MSPVTSGETLLFRSLFDDHHWDGVLSNQEWGCWEQKQNSHPSGVAPSINARMRKFVYTDVLEEMHFSNFHLGPFPGHGSRIGGF